MELHFVASEHGHQFRGVYRPAGDDSSYLGDQIISDKASAKLNDGVTPTLYAGTSWFWSGEESLVDVIFVDEASQMGLAHALAVSFGATHGMVLVGDPQQLPQVTKAAHPDGTELSVLEYLMQGRRTIDPDRGVLLPITRRMHPDVCSFISDAVYDSELFAHDSTALHTIDAPGAAEFSGSGLRYCPVETSGCSSANEAEMERVTEIWHSLLGATFTDREGKTSQITASDILVVAPYNVQVRLIEEALPEGARVGTVDRFQGQQAPVVIYSLTTSSRDDAPRDLSFILSRNRFNVAISRAQALAVLVASPALVGARCSSIDEIYLANVLCGFVGRAHGVGSASRVN